MNALLISLQKRGERTFRVTFEDCLKGEGISWNITERFAYHDFQQAMPEATEFTQEELAGIGLAVVSRLLAYESTRKT